MDANELATAREYWASQNILQGSDEIEHRLSINLILDALEAAERERDELRAAVRALAHYAWHEDRCPGPHIAGERCPLLHARNLPAVQRALEASLIKTAMDITLERNGESLRALEGEEEEEEDADDPWGLLPHERMR